MNETVKTYAIILAGGVGNRFGEQNPKQFFNLAGKPILVHTLDAFEKNAGIDGIVLVCHQDYVEKSENLISKYGISKVIAVVPGGKNRNHSTSIGIKNISQYCEAINPQDNILVHDGVRPFISDSILERCYKALDTYNAIDVCIPSSDTLIMHQNDIIVSIPDRSKLRRGQTPQGFKYETLCLLYDNYDVEKDIQFTDDCGLMRDKMPEQPIAVVLGDETNIKITTKFDVYIADKILQNKTHTIKQSNHMDLKGKVIVVFGGSYGIGAKVVQEIQSFGGVVIALSRDLTATDISKPDNVKQSLDRIYKEYGKIDGVVNCAGILNKKPLTEMTDAELSYSVESNHLGALYIAKYAFPYLNETQGHLILFSSSSFSRGRGNYVAYSSSKAAIVNMMQALVDEWCDTPVKVNAVIPARTNTPMRQKNFGKEDISTLLDVKVVANRVLDVLSQDSTGQLIEINKNELEG